MSFLNRTTSAKQLAIHLDALWASDPVKSGGLRHEPLGYETHVSPEVMSILKWARDPTAALVRYFPDALLVQLGGPTVLLEHKVMRTPRYSLGDRQWDQGQIEASAWDVYVRLASAGLSVAVVSYCPYHPRPLLADFVSESWVTLERTRPRTSRGSGTPYVNVDLRKMRTLLGFLAEEFSVDADAVHQWTVRTKFWSSLRVDPDLELDHHPTSPDRGRGTGFNWDPRHTPT